MAPFQYDSYRNPYVGSIGDLILRRGEIATRQAEQVAAAQARAAETRGQAWAGAVGNIAQTVAAIPQQIQSAKRQALQDDAARLAIDVHKQQLTTAQRVEQTKQRINQLASDPSIFNEDGTFNLKSLAEKMATSPPGAAGPVQAPDLGTIAGIIDPINKSLAEARTARVQWEEHKTNTLARIASTAFTLGAPNDANPKGSYLEHAQLGLAAALKSGLITQDEASRFLVPMVERPEAVPQMLQGIAARSTAAPIKLGEHDRLVNPLNPTQVLVGGTSAPKTRAELAADAANPQSPTRAQSAEALKLGFPQTPKSLQSENEWLVDGKSTPVVFDPATGRRYLSAEDVTAGRAIDPARMKKIPAASITIQNDARKALANLPTWALDDSRPTGADANKLDPAVRMTPNGLYQAATTYIATGQFPPTGRGNDPAAQAMRAAITSKVGAIAAASGMDEPALRAFYKSNAASLTQQQKSYDAVAGFMATADKNADLLGKVLPNIPDLGSPLLNQPLRSLDQKALGSVSMSQFKTYVQSVQNEYARIISQPNLAGQLTDSARHEAEQLLDKNATVAQIIGSIQALKNEGTNRLVSIGDQIQRIQQRMKVPGGAADGRAPRVYYDAEGNRIQK